MTKDEYIGKVLAHIHNKAYLVTIKNELENHIADRESYYMDIGYDSESACQKTLEHMGNADKVGEEMNRLHDDKKLKIICCAAMVLSVALYIIFYCIEDRLTLTYSALHFLYRNHAIVSAFAILFYIGMTIAYCCAVKTRQNRLMYSCGSSSIYMTILFSLEIMDYILPVANFRQAIGEIKNADSILTIFNDFTVYEFMFALLLSLILILTLFHGIAGICCSYEFKAFEKGEANIAIIHKFDRYKKVIISISSVLFILLVMELISVSIIFI